MSLVSVLLRESAGVWIGTSKHESVSVSVYVHVYGYAHVYDYVDVYEVVRVYVHAQVFCVWMLCTCLCVYEQKQA